MDFPRFVYISPGKTKCQGGSFDGEIVADQENFEAAISAGYSATVPEALAAAEDARILAKAEMIKPSAAETEANPKDLETNVDGPVAKRRGQPRR